MEESLRIVSFAKEKFGKTLLKNLQNLFPYILVGTIQQKLIYGFIRKGHIV